MMGQWFKKQEQQGNAAIHLALKQRSDSALRSTPSAAGILGQVDRNYYPALKQRSDGASHSALPHSADQRQGDSTHRYQENKPFSKTLAKQTIAIFSSLMIAVQPVFASGITTTPISGNLNTYPSANGVPVVDIVNPNAQGVSHNLYGSFDVGTSGVILNNVDQNFGNSQLGGVLSGNANLVNGSARVIINEVIYNNPSELLGAIEVAGGRADVIIANPYGITCDGCGFINTDHATLTTGTPFYEGGSFVGLNVSRGAVVIGALGANATGASQFDIISRTAQIDGTITGQSVNIIAGQNNIIYATGAISKRDGDGTDAPIVSIDSNVLGGMYADSIKIISTEQGSGVKAPPKMAANAGEMVITADGKLVMGEAVAKKSVTIKAKTVTVKKVVQSQERIHIEAARDAVIEANGQLVAQSGLEITTGGQLDANAGAQIITNSGALSAIAGGDIHLGQDVVVSNAGGAATLTSNANINLATGASVIATGDANLTATNLNAAGRNTIAAGVADKAGNTAAANANITLAGKAALNDTMVYASNDLNIRAQSIESTSTGIAPTKFVAGHDINITDQATGQATGVQILGGEYQAGNAIKVTAASIHNTAKMTAYGSTFNLKATSGNITNSGALGSAGTITLDGQNITNTAALTGQSIALKASASLDHSGQASAHLVSLDVAGDVTNSGTITSNIFGKISADGAGIEANTIGGNFTNTSTGAITANYYALANIGGNFSNAGSIASAGKDASTSLGQITLAVAGDASNSGSITAKNTLEFSARNLTNAAGGTLQGGLALLSASQNITNDGSMIGKDMIAVSAGASLQNTGTIQGAALTKIASLGLVNSGTISASSGVTQITAKDSFDNGSGTIYGEKGIELKTNAGIDSANLGNFNTVGYLDLAGVDGGSLAYFNVAQDKEFGAIGNVWVKANSISNAGAIYSADGNLTLKSASGITNFGTIYAGGEMLSLLASGVIDNNGGSILANNKMLIAGVNFDGTNGDRAAKLINQHQGLIETFNGDMWIYAGEVENKGGDVSITNVAPVSNTQKIKLTSGSGSISGDNGYLYDMVTTTDSARIVNIVGGPSKIVTGGNLVLNAVNITNSYSLISSSGNIDVQATQFTNLNEKSTTDKIVNVEHWEFVDARWPRSNYNRILSTDPAVFTQATTQEFFGTIEAGGSITGSVTGNFTNGVAENVNNFAPSGATAPSTTAKTAPGLLSGLVLASLSIEGIGGDLGRTNVDISSVDNTNLFVFNTAAPHGYLIESRYDFIDQASFASSDYFLSQIGFDGAGTQTRLGDAMVETTYIRDQIYDMTGKRILNPGMSEKEQLEAMYKNALEAKNKLELRPGITLSAAQQAALTDDIVWLEEKIVNGQRVLVPVVYLAGGGAQYASLGGAQITAGGGINLDVGSFTNNGGDVTAGKTLRIHAETDIINNGGNIFGGLDQAFTSLDGSTVTLPSVMLIAGGNVANYSGVISGQGVVIEATNIIVETSKRTFGDDKNYTDIAMQTAGIHATGDLTMIASNDITFTGADITAGGNGLIQAGGDIEFNALELKSAADIGRGDNYYKMKATNNDVTTVNIGGNLNVYSTGIRDADGKLIPQFNAEGKPVSHNIIFAGTDVKAGGHIGVRADDGAVLFTAVRDEYSSDSSYSSGGVLSSSSGRDQVYDLTHKTASLTGSSISVSAAGSVLAYGTDFNTIGADGKVLTNEAAALAGSLNVKSDSGNILFYAVQNIHAQSHEKSSSYLGGLISYESEKSSLSTKYDGVNVNALTDVNLSAKGDLLLQGGEYNVGGNVGLDIGGKIYLQGTVDTQYSFSHVNDNNGFTITDTTKVNQTQVAHMPSMVVGGTNGIALSDKVVLGGKNEDGSVGLTHDGAWVGAGTLAGLFPKEGGDKGSGGGKDPYAGDTTTQVASINPEGVGYEYLKAINDNTNTVDGKAVNLTTINYKEQTVQLGTLGQLAVMIATNAIAPGLANSLSGVLGLGAGTASQAALSAMVKAAVSQGFTGMITGEIDIANAAAAIGSAGLGSFLTTGFGNLITEGMSPAQLAAYQASPIGAQNGLLSTQYITNGMSGAFINAGVTSMTYGTDFMDNMTTNIQNFGINALTDLGYYGAGEFKQYASLGDGTFSASIVHGVIGCASAKAQGATCAQGFTTSFATEAFSGMFDKGYVADPTKSAAEQESARKAYEQNNAMLFGSIVGTIVSGGDMNLMNIGGGLSTSATANNRQLHIKEAELIRKYAGEYAKERRITLAQAEKELTEQALRQVDENWAKQTTQNDKASTFLAGLASGTIAGTEGTYASQNQQYFQANHDNGQFQNPLINGQFVKKNGDLYSKTDYISQKPNGVDRFIFSDLQNYQKPYMTNEFAWKMLSPEERAAVANEMIDASGRVIAQSGLSADDKRNQELLDQMVNGAFGDQTSGAWSEDFYNSFTADELAAMSPAQIANVTEIASNHDLALALAAGSMGAGSVKPGKPDGVNATYDGLKNNGQHMGNDWPYLSGELKDASNAATAALEGRGKINFGMGSYNNEQTIAMGEAWVGPNYRVTSKGFYESADGLRQFRPPTFKPDLGMSQANFEQRVQPSGEWGANGHVDIIE